MAISANEVKELKEMTGCGLKDCRDALEKCDGDVSAAVKYLREKGLAKAAKKAGRIAAEGLVYTLVQDNCAVVLEINSETDFAAKTDKFKEFVEIVAKTIIKEKPADIPALLNAKPICGEEATIEDVRLQKIATIGENINIRRFQFLEGNVYAYTHDGGGSIIGAIAEINSSDNDSEEVKRAAKDVLLQIAALPSQYVSKDDLPKSVVDEEYAIQLKVAKDENANSPNPKPDKVIETIVQGRMRKFAEEVCLLSQRFFKNDSLSIEDYLKSIGKDMSVVRFARFEKGEGIEKKEDDFAAEVAALTGNS